MAHGYHVECLHGLGTLGLTLCLLRWTVLNTVPRNKPPHPAKCHLFPSLGRKRHSLAVSLSPFLIVPPCWKTEREHCHAWAPSPCRGRVSVAARHWGHSTERHASLALALGFRDRFYLTSLFGAVHLLHWVFQPLGLSKSRWVSFFAFP